MKTNTHTNKKKRIIIRFIILLTILIVSQITYSCFKENNTPPVYNEIPDANFNAYLKTIVPDAFTPDNKFISNHPSVVSYNERISVPGKNITSLSGIEYFTSLTRLDCEQNQLTALDVSKNTALTVLICGENQLTAFDVSMNVNLTRLECSNNQLTTIDVSKNTNLTELNCSKNQLTTLALGNNEVLKRVYCTYNQLTTLDVSKNKSLKRLECCNNKLKTLDISKNTNLSWLYIDISIKCSHPSIKAFKDRGGNLMNSYITSIPPFTCP
jgi:Leucine-rich repeat (LRR) protein